jgi:hypothetical protein
LGVGFIAHAQEQFSRKGLEKVTFVPKGQWVTGLNVNYAQSNSNNFQFFIVEGINGNTYNFKVSPMACYLVADNLGVGGRFSYERSRYKIDHADLVIDSETDHEVNNLYAIEQTFYTTALMRNYLSFGHSKRFGMYSETQLSFGVGQSKYYSGNGTDFSGSYEDTYRVNVGVAPGMIMFLNNYSAIEVNVGVLGFGYKHARQKTDQIYVSNRHTTTANFRINLFSISFGVAFYL